PRPDKPPWSCCGSPSPSEIALKRKEPVIGTSGRCKSIRCGHRGRSQQSARADRGRQRAKAAAARRKGADPRCAARWPPKRRFCPDRPKSPVKSSPFVRIPKRSRGRYDGAQAARLFCTLFESWSAPMDSSHLAQHAGTAGTLFASIFLVATSTMRTMIPLRLFSILTNLVLMATAIPAHNYVLMLVQTLMLVFNSYRLHQMLQLIRDVKRSVGGDLSIKWLKPFMIERKCKAGEMLFYKDEKAEDMQYIVSGRFRLVESGIELPVGAIVGELGMLSPSNVRTQSLECI